MKNSREGFFCAKRKNPIRRRSSRFKERKKQPYWVPNHAERRVYHPQLVAVYHQHQRCCISSRHSPCISSRVRVHRSYPGIRLWRKYPRPAPGMQASRSSGGVTELDFAQERKNAVRIDNSGKKAPSLLRGCFFGAATQIRTGDLILTKDVLYQLSHSSNLYPLRTFDIITNSRAFVNRFLKKVFEKNKNAVFFVYAFLNFEGFTLNVRLKHPEK